MTAPHLTSVIMVTYHTGPVLDRAIASVLAQTADVELILVNNGNTPEVEAQLVKRFRDEPLVRLMTGHGNVGSAKGRNLGARVAKGDHFLFLAPNCILQPDAVARLHKAAHEVKRPYAIGARIVDERKRDVPDARQNLLTPVSALVQYLGLHAVFPHFDDVSKQPMPKVLSEVPAISGNFMFLPRPDFIMIRGFDEGYFLGPIAMDFFTRFSRMGGHCYFAPDIIAVQDRRSPVVLDATVEKQRVKGLVRFFHENFSHIYPQPVLWLFDLVVTLWAASGALARRIAR